MYFFTPFTTIYAIFNDFNENFSEINISTSEKTKQNKTKQTNKQTNKCGAPLLGLAKSIYYGLTLLYL